MKNLTPKTWLLGAALLAGLGSYGGAQILRLDLQQMVQMTDGAIYGEIVGKETVRIDHPVDGPELYFTTLTIEGTRLENGKNTTVQVSFPGGFINADEGVYNSEAPEADTIAIGKHVVAFHVWSDNMGGDFASNALCGSHGGIYPTFENTKGEIVVQGRGEGYAIPTNIRLGELTGAIRKFDAGQNR